MSPVTHFLIGWSIANSGNLARKDRAIVTVAAIAADIDGAGLLLDLLGTGQGSSLEWWSTYHHVFGHNLGFGLFLVLAALVLGTKRWQAAILVAINFHLHLLCDLLGSKGPDGYQWPIPYLLPFSDGWQWTWSGQWELNAWQNVTITMLFLWHMFYLAWKKEVSPLEMVSTRADLAFVKALQERFGQPRHKRS